MKTKIVHFLTLTFLLFSLLLPTQNVYAAIINVESTADGPANPAHCPGAACTLRDAVAKANTGDTIQFNLASLPATITLTNGQIEILEKSLDIQGPGPADLTISGNNSSRIFFTQSLSSQDISISGMTILNGRTTDASGGAIFSNTNLTINNVILTQNATFITDPAYRYQFGGAIYHGYGSLIITNSQITENYASYEGGGLYVRDADLTMSNVSITSNYTDLSYFSSGAGLYIAKLDPHIPDPVTVNLNHVNILYNTTYSGGGGIYTQNLVNLNLSNSTIQGNETIIYSGGGINTANLNATVTINNSNISDNLANGTNGTGGGLYSASQLVVNNSTISNNSTLGDGGAIHQQTGSLTLDGVTLDGNQAEKSGGAIYLGNDSSLDITDSTITNNQSQLGGGIFSFNSGITTIIKTTTISNNHSISQNGGGAFLGGQVDIENSTISGNSSYLDGGGLLIYASTGGSIINSTISGNTSTTGIAPAYINSISGNFTLNHVTIAGNNSTNNIGGLSVGENVFLKNSILADNISGGTYASTDPDCIGTINSQDYNLIESSGNCTLTGTTTHNITGQDPMLDTLKDNGGSTLTMSLLPGSPAIDPTGNTTCLTEDQRGSLRPQDGNNNGTATCDIGAVEVNGPLAVQSVTRHDANPTSASSVDFTVTFSEDVTGVSTSAPFNDFELDTTGVTGAAITGVSGSGSVYTVSVNTGSGNGTIRLDLPVNADITDLSGNPLSNLPYTGDESYSINKTIRTILYSTGSQDGWVLESSETSESGGTVDSTSTVLMIGDDASDRQYRSMLSFDTSSLPDTAVITQAVLSLRVNEVLGGGNPIKVFNYFMADMRTGSFGASSALAAQDFGFSPTVAVGPLGALNRGGWYYVDLKTGKSAVNLTGLTQVRLRFSIGDNDNGIANIIKIYSGNSTVKPQLSLWYYVP